MSKIKKFFSFLGKALDAHPITFCAILSVIENFAIESMSRHSIIRCFEYIIKSPSTFFYNCLIIMFTLTLCLLFKRRVFGIVLFSAPWLIFGLINSVVLSYRVTPLGAIDFQIVKLSLILVYLTKWQRILVYVAAGAFIVSIIALWIVGPKISGKVNYGKTTASIIVATNLAFSIKAISTDFGNIAGAYKDYGFVYCFSSSMIDTGIDKPSEYSEETTKEILASLPPQNNEENLLKPDIILIQLESFIDPKTIKDITYSDDPAPIHTYLK